MEIRVLTWQGHARSTYRPTEPLEESRQYYVTVRIQDMQRVAIGLRHKVLPLDFSELVRAFRVFGEEYDRGARLRDDLVLELSKASSRSLATTAVESQ